MAHETANKPFYSLLVHKDIQYDEVHASPYSNFRVSTLLISSFHLFQLRRDDLHMGLEELQVPAQISQNGRWSMEDQTEPKRPNFTGPRMHGKWVPYP